MKPRLQVGANVEVDAGQIQDVAAAWLVPGHKRTQRPATRPTPVGWVSLLTLALMFHAGTAGATIIAGVRSEREIVVAADGMQASPLGPAPPVCKLGQVGDFVFGLSGWVHNALYAVDLYEVTRRSAALRPGFARNASVRRVVRAIEVELTALIRAFPWAYMSLADRREGEPPTSLLVMYFDREGIAHVRIRNFRVVTSGPPRCRDSLVEDPTTGRVRVASHSNFPPDGEHDDLALFGIGAGMPVAEHVAYSTPHYFPLATRRPGGLSAAVYGLIDAAIGALPEYCGPPISVARINANGIKWIEPGECNPE